MVSALNFAEQKSGHQMNANTNEKITDGARELYEKTTGYVYFSQLLGEEGLTIFTANTSIRSSPTKRVNHLISLGEWTDKGH